jgi:hypothetical protein
MSTKILILSDEKYEFQADYFIQSLIIQSGNTIPIVYYTIGFNSKLNYPNLITKYYPKIDIYGKEFWFYKPNIILDAIDYFGGNFLFMDCDILVGRRFSIENFVNHNSYPLLSVYPLAYPIVFGGNISDTKIHNPTLTYIGSDGQERLAVEVDDGSLSGVPGTIIYNEAVMMNYLGVSKRTMDYVGTMFISFSDKCRDLIFEWCSIIENKWILSQGKEFLPLWEETALNVILWKRGATKNYPQNFINTHRAEILQMVEQSDDLQNYTIENNIYQYCRDSREVVFYHGFKDREESQKALDFLKQNKHYEKNKS